MSKSPSKLAKSLKQGSIMSSTKRSKANKKKADENIPQPEKLVIVERKLHSDDLKEQHFIELRQFLHKKQRQEAIAAKM